MQTQNNRASKQTTQHNTTQHKHSTWQLPRSSQFSISSFSAVTFKHYLTNELERLRNRYIARSIVYSVLLVFVQFSILNNDQDSPQKITKITESFYIFQIQFSQNHILDTVVISNFIYHFYLSGYLQIQIVGCRLSCTCKHVSTFSVS